MIDRPVLLGNLVSGALLLGCLAVVSWPLAALGLVYVVPTSVLLAAAYGREALSARREAAVWLLPWLAAVALWTWLIHGIDGGQLPLLPALGAAVAVATPGFLAWQAGALAVRQLLGWRRGRRSPVTAE